MLLVLLFRESSAFVLLGASRMMSFVACLTEALTLKEGAVVLSAVTLPG